MESSLVWGRYAITSAGVDGSVDVVDNGAVYQEDGTIVEVGAYDDLQARYQPDEVIGSTDHAVIPGLINAHHHVGLTPLQLGTLDDALEPWITDRLSRRAADPYLDTMWGAITMIESGITTVMHNDTSIVGTQPLDRALDVLRAYTDSGMRVAFSVFYREQNRLVYDDDEAFLQTLPADLAAPTRAGLAQSDMSHEIYLSLFEELHQRFGQEAESRVRILLAPGNVQWCSDEYLEKVKEAAQRVGTGIHIHLLESPYQKVYAERTWGTTMVAHLDALGFLGPEVSCAHGVWLAASELELLAQSGTTVCHNPSSNLRLKSGIAPVNRMLAAGVPVALGIDEATINDDNDLLQEMRLAAKLHREPGVLAPQLTSGQVLHMATAAGATATCFGTQVGRLAAGMRADIVQLKLNRIEEPYLSPTIAPADALVGRGRATDVDTVIVDGQVLLRDGRLVGIDRQAIVNEIQATMGLPETADEIERRRQGQELVGHVNAFYAGWDLAQGDPHYVVNQV